MKYIAFEGTYNEQVYDSEARAVTWTDGTMIKDVEVITEDDAPHLTAWKRCEEVSDLVGAR